MKLTVSVGANDQLSERMKAAMGAVQLGLRAGCAQGALLMEKSAKGKVPVKTGSLRDSIETHHTVDEAAHQEFTIAPDTPYARRIEYGFIGQDSLGRHYHQQAQPYMRPAFDENKDRAAATIRESVLAELAAAER